LFTFFQPLINTNFTKIFFSRPNLKERMSFRDGIVSTYFLHGAFKVFFSSARQIFLVWPPPSFFRVSFGNESNLLPNNYPHYSSAYDDTSKQVLVHKRGKKRYQRFLYPVNHLNQRESSSATLVSKEIETDFFRRRRSRFSLRPRIPPGHESRVLPLRDFARVLGGVSSISSEWRSLFLGR
jgi:hypothetical protein